MRHNYFHCIIDFSHTKFLVTFLILSDLEYIQLKLIAQFHVEWPILCDRREMNDVIKFLCVIGFPKLWLRTQTAFCRKYRLDFLQIIRNIKKNYNDIHLVLVRFILMQIPL